MKMMMGVFFSLVFSYIYYTTAETSASDWLMQKVD